MTETILVVNAGSSSIKFQLFELELLTSLSGVSKVKSKVSVSSPDCLPKGRREILICADLPQAEKLPK
jgi:acetate kinase